MHFHKLQDLARQGRLPKTILGCDPPICQSCQFGKAYKQQSASPATAHPIDSGNLKPGDKVSVDQLESTTPGFVGIYKRKHTTAKYHAASVYVDHKQIHIPQMPLLHMCTKAVKCKQQFEQLAVTHGIIIKAYRADNSIMACHKYVHNVIINQQSISYCGVNAHG